MIELCRIFIQQCEDHRRSMRMTKKDNRILYCYYCAELILLLVTRVLEFYTDPRYVRPCSLTALLYYSAIVCNFLMIIYLYFRQGRRLKLYDNLIPLAFLFTLIADLFTCIIDGYRIIGYFLFVVVETVYMIYLRPTWKNILIRVGLCALMLLTVGYLGLFNAENGIGLVNVAQLTVNLVCAWAIYVKSKERKMFLFSLGLTLFAGCDYSILVRTLFDFLSNNIVSLAAAHCIWTFYIPSQVLLLSSYVKSLRDSD